MNKTPLSKIDNFSRLNSTNTSYQNNSFIFLNLKKTFSSTINWDFDKYGMLWSYNLNYFDFLNQTDLKEVEKLSIIRQFINSKKKIGLEPYPTSLRLINWIKFLAETQIYDEDIIDHIHKDVKLLFFRIEYQIGGNHVLENAFALYFSAHLFPKNRKLVKKSIFLLRRELDEQILDDGAHYERSFMYHQIILGRLLECISLSKSNSNDWNSDFIEFLSNKASNMLSWMICISNKTQIYQRFNDSIEGVGPKSSELLKLASNLGIDYYPNHKLTNSGFRILKTEDFFITANIGSISPSYQPGHAHADTFSFTLHYKNEPIIVDPGISTYENNTTRHIERSTEYHNTVTVNQSNNNEVWSAFRVGRRAETNLISDTYSNVEGIHDGFKLYKIQHRRKWLKEKNKIKIIDSLEGNKSVLNEAHFHLHPSISILRMNKSYVLLTNHIKIEFTDYDNIKIKDYNYCFGFNQTHKAPKLIVSFREYLITTIGI